MALLSRARIAIACALIAGGWLAANPTKAGPTSLEYAVKAAYLYKFAPFVAWPARVFPSPTSPFTICVAGADPFGPLLDDVVKGQKLDEHPIVVRRMAGGEGAASCQILFIGHIEPQAAADLFHAVDRQPVITVTDKSHGVSGGVIEFVMEGGRVRFDIDEAAAEAAGAPISSKLLGLAASVRKAPK
jgi:hypothetical protein